VVLFLAASAVAQMHETVNVHIVEVPVSVVDSGGNPIRGLTAANFELYDGGKKQAITSFDKVDFGSTEAVSAISPLNPAARRSFLLLFDLGYSSPRSLVRAQEAAHRFVTTTVQPRDLVGVGTIDVERGFRLLTAFTSDHDLVAAAISNPGNFHGSDPLQIGNKAFVGDITLEGAPQQVDPNQSAIDEEGAKSPHSVGNRGARDMAELQVRFTRSNEEAISVRVQKQVDFLADLAKTLRGVPGRKQVVLLSEGFDAKYLQGRDARDVKANNRDFESATHGEVWNVESDRQYGSTSNQSSLDRMVRAFRSSDIVLNAIDIQGVRVQSLTAPGVTGTMDVADAATAGLNSNAGLHVLSRPTGGEVFQNSNDLKGNFDRMLHAQEVVYILSFQSTTANPGKFHDLKVKLVNSPGRVSYRQGYFETGGESSADRALTNAEVIVNDIAQDDLHLAAFAAPFPTAKGWAQVPVILDLNGADLARQAKGNAAGAEVFIYAFDSNGLMRDRLYQRLSLDMTKIGDRLKASGVRYYGTLVLPPGKYAIKALVLAGGEKRGFKRVDVTVPTAGDISVLPPIPIDEQPKWILVKSADRGEHSDYPFELNGQNFIPSATASSKVAVMIFGAAADELTWETTPKTKLLGTIPMAGGTKFVLQLDDPSQISALQITVHKKGVVEAQTTSVAVVRE
jgi:VWFA-related protein